MDESIVTFAKRYSLYKFYVKINVNENDLSELQGSRISKFIKDDEEINVVACKAECQRYNGHLRDLEAIDEFMGNLV